MHACRRASYALPSCVLTACLPTPTSVPPQAEANENNDAANAATD